MLKPESIEKIFSIARAKDLRCAELYLEKSTTESLFFQGKHHKSLISQTSGASLSCMSPSGLTQLLLSEISPEALTEALGSTAVSSGSASFSKSPVQYDSATRERLKVFARKVENLSPQFSFEYAENKREFAVIDSEGRLTKSKDEKVRFQYRIQKEGNFFQKQDFQTNIDSFWQRSFQEKAWIEQSKERLQTPSLWPLPEGEVPLLLSRSVLAKILFKVLTGFEADSLFAKKSFLNFLDDSPVFSFSLVESPEQNQVDQEGESTHLLNLFSEGEFKDFATDKRLANALELPKSGHGRRMNYQEPPTISLFSTNLVPNENLWLNFSALKRAILIEEMEILDYDPKTTRAKIAVTHSKLVHQGDFGEKLVRWEWNVSLLEILTSLKQFSKNSSLHGFENKKGKSILPSQITCPDALLEGLSIAGTVPQEYYWES